MLHHHHHHHNHHHSTLRISPLITIQPFTILSLPSSSSKPPHNHPSYILPSPPYSHPPPHATYFTLSQDGYAKIPYTKRTPPLPKQACIVSLYILSLSLSILSLSLSSLSLSSLSLLLSHFLPFTNDEMSPLHTLYLRPIRPLCPHPSPCVNSRAYFDPEFQRDYPSPSSLYASVTSP